MPLGLLIILGMLIGVECEERRSSLNHNHEAAMPEASISMAPESSTAKQCSALAESPAGMESSNEEVQLHTGDGKWDSKLNNLSHLNKKRKCLCYGHSKIVGRVDFVVKHKRTLW
jgi:hypothetical protein